MGRLSKEPMCFPDPFAASLELSAPGRTASLQALPGGIGVGLCPAGGRSMAVSVTMVGQALSCLSGP